MSCSELQPDGSIGTPTSLFGVIPQYCENWTSGDAGQECVVNLGYDFGLKLDDNAPNGYLSGACDGQGSCELGESYNNFMTIFNSDGVYFDWLADPYVLSAVVVKGGNGANVFTYQPGASNDGRLYAPMKVNGDGPRDISHVSFCWNRNEGRCYQEETAWAVGNAYTPRGNWAMYVDYFACDEQDGIVDGKCQVDIMAAGGDGIGLDAGYALLETDGNTVKISIFLENNFTFYYDLNDSEQDENLKVQGYDSEPKGNPAIGRFADKLSLAVGSTTAELIVPFSPYYGIHLDVAGLGNCNTVQSLLVEK